MKRIGVLTSGGDAPGMNAAIRAVVRAAIFNGLEVVGVKRGFVGLMDGDFVELGLGSVGGILQRGGTILQTARSERFKTEEGLREALNRLEEAGIDALVVIGGEGSFKGAWELYKRGIPTIGIPGTIDNDIAGTDYTIGFDTAVNIAVEAINRLRDTASSHERMFIVEVMGRKSGYIALMAGVASGAESILIPEMPYDMENICMKLRRGHQRGKTHSIIVVAEGVASAAQIRDQILDKTGYEVRIVVLGHLQRGGSPTAFDRILASRLGAKSVELLLNGIEGKMVGWEKGNISVYDLSYSWENVKGIDIELYRLADMLSI
ncbi:MAG: 6-phosphofructokinase [Synergistetes bacterium]|nr:6-phosphofructokinase [Synergistota bacterium]MCX8127424.1 6-phosphofructokinase [Synergistota bacterium]MDW8192288.1 6-phosphofructokinase [Synergistota bacterium]